MSQSYHPQLYMMLFKQDLHIVEFKRGVLSASRALNGLRTLKKFDLQILKTYLSPACDGVIEPFLKCVYDAI